MDLQDLFEKTWNSYEERRFTKADPKVETDRFDPHEFGHYGFDDREKYLNEFVPGLADEERLRKEMANFRPPRLGSINDSPYQALVLRYGILRSLIKELDYSLEKHQLMENVQNWQREIIENFERGDFSGDDELLNLAKACVDYGGDVDDSELNLVHTFFELHNQSQTKKQNFYTWMDFFKRLSALDRFPKVTRSDKPEHALDTIEKGIWSLQEQAIVYEVKDPDEGDLVGIPEEFAPFIRDWLYYEMSDENYRNMLESLAFFNNQSNLVEARDKFDVTIPTQGYNDRRRESLVQAGVFPSELLDEMVPLEELRNIVDEYGLDANKRFRDDMIETIVDYFEHSQKYGESDDPDSEIFLNCYEDIADGNVERVPPQIQEYAGGEEDRSKRMDILFERATAEIFENVFTLSGTNLLGQTSSGVIADGEIEQNGEWLLWDNKRRSGPFKLDSSTRSKIRDYIDMKDSQHEVRWFLIIAPAFADSVEDDAEMLEKRVGGVDVRLVTAEDFRRLAEYWIDAVGDRSAELPLPIFHGAGELNLETAYQMIDQEFA